MRLFSILALLVLSSAVFAHAHYVFDIGGKEYGFEVGSLNEPVFVDEKSGVELSVNEIGEDDPTPVTGLEETLRVEVGAGSQKKTLDLEPAWSESGAYEAVFYPTVATTYTYRVFGTINGVQFDYSFACNPAGHVHEDEQGPEQVSAQVRLLSHEGTFGCPRVKADSQFPEKAQSDAETAAKITELSTKVSALEKSSMEKPEAEKPDQTIAIAAIGIAIGALAVSAVGLMRKK